MNVLVPMSESEYLAYVEEAVPAYAADKVASGHWQESEALERSRREHVQLLPQGLATPDNHLYTVREPATQAAVGVLWIAVQDRAGQRIAYVFDVGIEPEHQRRGHATRAFMALEDVVRSLGLCGVALHVFGHNVAAQALYASLGYRPTNINMFKAVASKEA